jgi:hypothetical protein
VLLGTDISSKVSMYSKQSTLLQAPANLLVIHSNSSSLIPMLISLANSIISSFVNSFIDTSFNANMIGLYFPYGHCCSHIEQDHLQLYKLGIQLPSQLLTR